MSQPFIGQITIFAGNFAPVGYAFCNGQLLSIAQYDALFNLIGTTYGGDGVNTFGLPSLQSRVPVHQGQGPGLSSYVLGQQGGNESVTLLSQQIPTHTHTALANPATGDQSNPAGAALAGGDGISPYVHATPATAMSSFAQAAGGSQPHDNRQPYLAISFIIALEGVFPTQN